MLAIVDDILLDAGHRTFESREFHHGRDDLQRGPAGGREVRVLLLMRIDRAARDTGGLGGFLERGALGERLQERLLAGEIEGCAPAGRFVLRGFLELGFPVGDRSGVAGVLAEPWLRSCRSGVSGVTVLLLMKERQLSYMVGCRTEVFAAAR